MKNATLMIMALALSTAAFAGTKAETRKEARKAAIETCKAEGKVKKELKACVKEKLSTTQAAAK